MTLHPFAHANASSIEEVIEIMDDECRPLAGGTDLLGMMKEGLISPGKLVNLKSIPEMDSIQARENGWHIGALATLSQLATDASVSQRPELACLKEAIVQAASPQLRNMATIGGNLLQRPRCWYYRNALTHCWLKGGDHCFALDDENKYNAILGGGPCYAVHPSDPAVALLALDAVVVVAGPAGSQQVPLGDLYGLPTEEARRETTLEVNELVTEIFVPAQAFGARGSYVKVAERALWDFALVSAAVQLSFSHEVVRQARVALGGVAPVPWRAVAAEEALVGKTLSLESVEKAAQAATTGARPLAQNTYKVDLVKGVVRQALKACGASIKGAK